MLLHLVTPKRKHGGNFYDSFKKKQKQKVFP